MTTCSEAPAMDGRSVALNYLDRIKPEAMTPAELDLAAGVLLGMKVGMLNELPCLVDDDGKPAGFSPSSNWEHFGKVLTEVELVCGSHARYDDASNQERVTGFWFSAHSFYGQTKTAGKDYRLTVLQTVAKRLAHDVQYPRDE